MNERIKAAREARLLALRNPTAVLSTVSKKLQGMPFGSVSPIMLTDTGQVIFYVSDIAQHARNLEADPRLSVTIFNPAQRGDQNEQGRLTLSGTAHKLSHDEGSEIEAKYLRLFPAAAGYKNAHDFHYWQMAVEHIRYIGGFGEIFWLTPAEWLLDQPQWNYDEEERMVEHMNDDHLDACVLMLGRFLESGMNWRNEPIDMAYVRMAAIYPDGCYMTVQGKLFFISFLDSEQSTPCLTSQDVRQTLVRLTRLARAA